MENEISLIHTWAHEKNLIFGSEKKTETLKLLAAYGKLARELNQGSHCEEAIGECLIYLIIICKMENVSLESTLEKTRTITDVRITEAYHLINVLADYLGKLAENILNNRDIKVSVGYILIYLTALTRVLNYCFRDCLEKAYSRVKRNKDIMFDGNYVGMKDEKYAEAKSLVKNRRLNDN